MKFCAAVFAIAASVAFAQPPAPGPPVLALQTGHTDSVEFMAISPDGRWVASSSEHGPVKVWSVSSALEVRSFSPDYARDIIGIDFTGDSASLFIRSSDGYLNEEVSLWEVTSGRELRRFRIGTDVRGTALSTDGAHIAVAKRAGVELWNVTNNRRIRTLGRGSADAVAFTPDGRALAIAAPEGLTVWEAGSGAQLATLPVALKTNPGGLRAVKTTGRLNFSPDGKWLAYQDDAERLWIWDMVPSSQPRLITRLTWPTVFQFTADSRELAVHESKSGRSTAFDPATGRQIRPFTARPATLVFGSIIGSNGKLLVGGGRDKNKNNNGLVVVELHTGRHVASLGDVVEWMSAVAVSPDDKWLVTASRNGSMSVWDTSRGVRSVHLTAHLSAIHALAFHPDGRVFASGGNEAIRVWDVQSGRELRTLQGVGGTLSLSFSRDGQWLASGGQSGKLVVWEVSTWTQRFQLNGNDDWVAAVDFSSNGEWLASAHDNGALRLWDFRRGKQLTELVHANDDAEFTKSMQFSPDGQRLAVGTSKRIRLLEFGDGYRLRSNRSLSGHMDSVTAVAFSGDGRRLASASVDRTVKLWDVRTGRESRTFQGHTGWINDVAFDHTGKWMASAGSDGAVRLWDVAAGHALGVIVSASGGWLAVAPDGLFDGEPDAMQQVAWRWGGGETTSLETYFTDFFYPGLLADLVSGARPRAEIDIATALQVPGLRTMLAQKLAHIERREDSIVVCFEQTPGAAIGVGPTDRRLVFPPVAGYRAGTTPTCKFEKPLTGFGESADALANRLQRVADQPVLATGVRTQSETRSSTLHVFAAAITQYAPELGFERLTYAVPSARAIQEFFTTQGSHALKPYADVVVWDGLFDADATRENIQKRFAAMAAAVKAEDVVLLYFAGHGKVTTGEEMFYFVPVDGHAANLRQTGVNTAMIADALRRLPARRAVIILDTCQSGAAIEALAKVAAVKESAEMRRTIDSAGAVDLAPEVGVHLIAATMPLSYAIGAQSGRSALAEALLSAVTPTGQTTISEVTEYLRANLPDVSQRLTGGFRQVPLISAVGSDFVLAVR